MRLTYRQIAHRLRIQRGPGNPDRISERPRAGSKGNWGAFLDSDAEPTLITFDDLDQVDVAALLASGAIQAYTPPAAPVKLPTKGASRG